MSKTITKKVKNNASVPDIKSALSLMEVNVDVNQCNMYGGRKQSADLVFTAEMLEQWGIYTAYGTDIGVIQKKGGLEFVYDHANEALVRQLEQMLPGFSQIGKQSASVDALIAKGYKLRPHIDAAAEEYGVFLEAPQGQQHVGGWGDGDDKNSDGGAW